MKPDDALKVSPEEKRAHEAVDDALYGDGTKENAHAAITAAVRAAEERGQHLAIPLIEATVQGAAERMRERCAKVAWEYARYIRKGSVNGIPNDIHNAICALPLTGDSDGE